ncbi:TPA: formyltransferase family protein, partial [Escherichia coli]
VFLGSRPLGYETIRILESITCVEIVGCVTKAPSLNAWWIKDPYEYSMKYKQLSLADLESIDFDFGVSINYWNIIPDNIIKKPIMGFVNLHHSFNLCYRGRDMTTYAIRDARKMNRWFHGTCLHYTNDGLDTGPIISSLACEISELDTAWTLFNKVEILGYTLLQEWLPRLVVTRIPLVYPEAGHPLSFRRDISKEIDIQKGNKLDLYDLVRSLDFNNHYEPSFYIKNGEKIYLTTNSQFGGDVIIDAGNDRKVYENISYSC